MSEENVDRVVKTMELQLIADLLNGLRDALGDGRLELDPCAELGPEFGVAKEHLRKSGWAPNPLDGRWQPGGVAAPIATVDPDVLGGAAVFIGSRVPVEVLFANLADGMSLDQILDAYPISRDSAVRALAFGQHALAESAKANPA